MFEALLMRSKKQKGEAKHKPFAFGMFEA